MRVLLYTSEFLGELSNQATALALLLKRLELYQTSQEVCIDSRNLAFPNKMSGISTGKWSYVESKCVRSTMDTKCEKIRWTFTPLTPVGAFQ